MQTPRIEKLGHVGLFVHDLERMTSFYRDVLGLTVTDADPEQGVVFLSARPEEEHHEFVLASGRRTDESTRLINQISFRCPSLEDVAAFEQRLRSLDTRFDMIVSHGNAIGVYFLDPEGNRCEVYCATGLQAKQPYVLPLNVQRPKDEVLADVEESVREYGVTGIIRMPERER
ncbi:VOC family protein [Burkholderia sp. MR1-5-21]